MGMNAAPRSSRQAALAEQDRKSHSADCRNCLILKSLAEVDLASATIHATCDRMVLHRMRRRQLLFLEGNPPTHLYAIRSGRVKLVKTDESGREHVSAILGSGDLFGFEAVFDSAYATSAEAMTDGEVCLASSAELKELLAELPGLALDLLRYLHFQICRSRDRQACLGSLGARAKLAGYLLHSLAGAETADRTVARDLTLRDLGGILGLSPETVCRTLGALRSRRIVEVLPAGIRVLDVPALRLFARL
jgi:CRP/FNR family transcriptional regulator, cyclic AMP receptor protein